jgi:hypothetical protein
MSAFRARTMAAALGIAPDEPDQVIRLGRFREEHPDVIIGDGGFGTAVLANRPGAEAFAVVPPVPCRVSYVVPAQVREVEGG